MGVRGRSALCWRFLLTLQTPGVRKTALGRSGFKAPLHSGGLLFYKVAAIPRLCQGVACGIIR